MINLFKIYDYYLPFQIFQSCLATAEFIGHASLTIKCPVVQLPQWALSYLKQIMKIVFVIEQFYVLYHSYDD